MKTKIVLSLLLAFVLLILCSCVSYLPPNSTVSSKSFSLISPNEQDWKFAEQYPSIRGYEYKTGELIWLHKGTTPGNWQSAEYPLKTILIIRDTILNTALDREILRTELNDIATVKVKNIVDSLFLWAGSLRNFRYDSLKVMRNNYNQYYYGVSWQPDSVGIGQYYMYLPKYYNEYKSYYLFIYDEFPAESLGNELTGIIERFNCVEDSVKQ